MLNFYMALHPAHIKEVKLKRSLTLLDVTVCGVGIILGAGIYALIGVASGYAGNTLWLSFVLAAVMSIFTGLSYAELSSIFKSDSTEYEYTKKAFNKTIATLIGILVVFTGIFAAATVSIGFANYLNAMTGLSIFITTVLYVLVAISAVSMLSYEKLSISKAPLAEAASVSLGNLGNIAFFVLAIIALFSTLNTVLLSLVTSSRLTYGLAEQNAIPKKFGEVHPRTRTPWLAIFLIGIISFVFVFFENIEIVANITNISIFLTFAFVNASLLILRYRINPDRVKFKVRFLSIGKFSVIALLGLLTSALMMVYSIINLV